MSKPKLSKIKRPWYNNHRYMVRRMKSNVEDGEWSREKDQYVWSSPRGEYTCVILRASLLHLCGYVGIPSDHRLFGVHYNDRVELPETVLKRKLTNLDNTDVVALLGEAITPDEDKPAGTITPTLAFDVHGGITYSDNHVPARCASDRWWFGFDCSHFGDLSPGLEWIGQKHTGKKLSEFLTTMQYRNVSFVRSQVVGLARQLWVLR